MKLILKLNLKLFLRRREGHPRTYVKSKPRSEAHVTKDAEENAKLLKSFAKGM
jgi:hypothetical protein